MIYVGFALKASVFMLTPRMSLIMGVQAVWNFYQPTSPGQMGHESERKPMKLCCMMRHQKAARSEKNQIFIFLLKCSHLTVTIWADQCGLKLK